MSDPFAYWRDKLAGKDPAPPADRTILPAGFWRLSNNKPLAVWPQDGETVALLGNWRMTPERMAQMAEQGGFGRAITEELYRAVAERGEPWPDMDRVVHEQVAPGRKHNNPPDDDPVAALRIEIENASEGAKEYATIDSEEKAQRAQSLRSRLNELSREADGKREAEKKPHLEAGKKVDARWMPLVKAAKETADKLARTLSAWATETLRIAEEKRRAAEDARRKAEQEARDRDITLSPEPPPAPEPAPPATPAQIKPAYGRTASVKLVRTAQITDWQSAAYHYSKHPDVQAAVQKAAQQDVTAGNELPACVTVEETRRVA